MTTSLQEFVYLNEIFYNFLTFSSKVWREISNPSSKQPQIHSTDDDLEIRNNDRNIVKWHNSSDDNDHRKVDTLNDNEALVIDDNNHHRKVITSNSSGRDLNYLALSDTDTVDCYTVPSPVYPASPTTPIYPSSTLPLPGPSSMKRRTRDQMTRHQIINLYCSNSDRER